MKILAKNNLKHNNTPTHSIDVNNKWRNVAVSLSARADSSFRAIVLAFVWE